MADSASHRHDHGHAHDPAHGHDHHHGHGHAHHHAPESFGAAFAIGITLNLGFTVIEAGAGMLSGSVALLADAGHNLSDVLGLLIAWAGVELGKRAPGPRFTYGLRASSILAALANAVLLFVALGTIAVEAVQRFASPQPVPGATVMLVAGIGIVINVATALLFARGRKGDINIRGAFLHMAGDAAVSAGVLVAGGLILLTGASWIDPAMALVVVALILWMSWGLFRESLAMILQAVPGHIDAASVRRKLEELPGVAHVHDLHIWPMSTTEVALTAHLVMPGGHPGDQFLFALQHRLAHEDGIGHSTVQIEIGDGNGDACRMQGNGHG